jgi:putative glutamine amidotransferase
MRIKKIVSAAILISLIPALAAAQTPPAAKGKPEAPPPRFFDTALEPHAKPRLTILYPTTGTIKALEALKEQGLFPAADIEVVGVHHAKETSNYKAAYKYVEDRKIDWLKFHVVSAEIGLADLWKPNAATKEFEAIFAKSDGLIFFGGPDIVPAAYGEKTRLQTGIEDPYRHWLELSLVFHLLGGSQNETAPALLDKRPKFAVLGICLGSQTLNIGTGGTLVQDIWSETYGMAYYEDVVALGQPNWHTNPWRKLEPLDKKLVPYMLHQIKLTGDGILCAGLGFKAADQPYVTSAHHQAAAKIGKGLKVAATSLDGKVVEAFGHVKYPNVLGVQFHPEFPMLWDTKSEYRFTPKDKDLFTVNGFLKSHAPSLDFQKKIWTWFFDKVKNR